MVYVAGMDIGAIAVKTMIVDSNGIISTSVFETGASPMSTATESLQAALDLAGIEYKDLSYIVTTGHGRAKIRYANTQKSEISAIAKGARIVNPSARVIADVGGQGIRVIRLSDDGSVEKFLNNDKCSSGTGCFLDTMAIALGVGLHDLGDLSRTSVSPSCMSTKCTIFAESEVVSLVARGTKKEDIIAGLHQSVAQKVQSLVRAIGGDGSVMICGGVVRNHGVIHEMEKVMGSGIKIAPHPQLITALGAAMYGLEAVGRPA